MTLTKPSFSADVISFAAIKSAFDPSNLIRKKEALMSLLFSVDLDVFECEHGHTCVCLLPFSANIRLREINRSIPAQRLAFALAYGSIPKGCAVVSNCINPHCIEPNHLILEILSPEVDIYQLSEDGFEAYFDANENLVLGPPFWEGHSAWLDIIDQFLLAEGRYEH